MNLALKYRPKVLTDIIGQPSVVQTLSNAISDNNLAQAYLFVGQFGSGKTTTARILAASENCLEAPGGKPTIAPCGKCDICEGIFDGSHGDIEEIDAASGAGHASEVRKLKQNAMYNPISGAKSKIFIIDECQRMSDTANDALLKILEEPPPHVRFILCTTDVQLVRPAVQSRCQRHDFGKIYWSSMSEALKSIAKSERVEISGAAITLCSKLANGSMRNALQNLDKLISFAGKGKEIKSADAQNMFGQADEVLYYDLFDQIIGIKDGKPDASEGFRVLNKMLITGAAFMSVYAGLAEHLNNLVIGLTSSSAGEFLHLSDEGKNRIKAQLKKCLDGKKLAAVLASIKNLHDAKKSVELNISPEMALQVWVVESIFAFRR